jgi:hypothetical protein
MSAPVPPLRRAPWIYGCLLFLLLSRLPAMLCPFEINLDEGQMAAQAMRYGHDLTPWRSVEGETNGPLDSWFLLGAHDLGMPLNYRALHILAALCLAGILLATYAAARRLVGEAAALVGLAAGSWWLAWAPAPDFIHYSSELVPALLLSSALAVIARARQGAAGPDWRLGLLAGLLLGLAPWGKLQAGPVALALGLWAVADAWRGGSAPRPARRQYAAALLAGAILPGLILLTWVVAAGAGEEFWRVYIINGLNNGRTQTWAGQLKNLWGILFWYDNCAWIWCVALLAAGAFWLRRRTGWGSVPRRIWTLALLWLVVGLFVALRPLTQRPHYAIFFLPPLMLGVVIFAHSLLAEREIGEAKAAGRTPLRRRHGWIILALALAPLPVVHFFQYDYFRVVQTILSAEENHVFDGQGFLVKAVRHFVPQPKSIAVWGWKPSIYVDLGLPPATRNAVYAFLTDGNPSQEFLRAAFMRDLATSRPEVIVDVEDVVYRGHRRTSPETFPALARYLAENYGVAGNAEVTRTADYSMVIVIYARVPH